MLEFEILARGYYRPEQLAIAYQPSLRMPQTPEIQQWMDILWEQKLVQARRNQTRLFDAPLFRLVELSSSSAQLSLVLGDTSYKEYVTTRVPEFAQNRSRPELGNPLSVCSVVETSDQYILLDRRQGVDVYVGRYHVIGGFFERELDMGTSPDPFAAMRREIREETGIQSSDILAQHCLGAVYDLATPHAELCFLTRLNIPLAVVQQERTPEEDEIKQLHSLQVTTESLRDFILHHHGNISATGEPNLLMYGALLFGEAWFANLLSQLLANS
ncbi:MAG TPA: NUDIX hydrolase [Ktedonobacteraceae bacterium]